LKSCFGETGSLVDKSSPILLLKQGEFLYIYIYIYDLVVISKFMIFWRINHGCVVCSCHGNMLHLSVVLDDYKNRFEELLMNKENLKES
jgi:hypothetical protein